MTWTPRPQKPPFADPPVFRDDVQIFQSTVTLTDAQIKVLPTTPVEIVAAPDDGFVLVPWMAFLSGHCVTSYTNIDPTFAYVTVVYGDDAIESMALCQNSDGQAGARVEDLSLEFLLSDEAWSIMLLNNGVLTASEPPQHLTNVGFAYESASWQTALNIYAYNSSSGNFTGGDAANTLTVSLLYTVLPV